MESTDGAASLVPLKTLYELEVEERLGMKWLER